MSKVYCSCQNYSGYLFVSPKELYFTSTLFRVELPYSNIKRISVDTKQVRGSPTSVLVIHLQKEQSVSLTASDGGAGKKKRSSKKYFFYGFHDLLGAEETIKNNWETAKRSLTEVDDGDSKDSNDAKADTMVDLPFEKASTQNSTSRPPPPQSAPPAVMRGDADSRISKRKAPSVPSERAGAPSTGARNVQRAICSALWSALKGLTNLLLSGGPITFLLVFLIFVLVIFSGYRVKTLAAQQHAPNRATAQLSERLAIVRQQAHQLDFTMSTEAYRDAQEEWGRIFEQSDEWIASLERAANELAHQYVYAQVEMAALRQRRLDRVGLEGYFSANEGRTGDKMRNTFPEFQPQESGSHDKGAHAKSAGAASGTGSEARRRAGFASTRRVVARSFSMRRARDDVTRWLSWVGWVQRAVVSVLPGNSFSLFPTKRTPSASRQRRLGAPNTRYAEPFAPGFDIAQQVSREEAEERDECVSLTNRVYELSREAQHLFHDFWSVLVANSAESFASGSAKPHHFAHVPAAVSMGGRHQPGWAYHPGFSGAQMLKLAFIRRYTTTMFFFDPIDTNENRRRMRSREASRLFHLRIGRDTVVADSESADNVTSVGSRLLEYITGRVVTPDSKPLLIDTLRNLLEEIILWNRYPEEWSAHRLRTLSHLEQQHVMQLIYRRLESSGKTYVTRAVNATEAADRYLERMRTVRPHHLDNVPVFRGMLCFSKHPVLHHHASSRPPGDDVRTAGNATPSAFPTATPPPLRPKLSAKELDGQEAQVRSLLQSIRERWMNELDIYDISIGDSPASQRGVSRSVLLDDDLHSTNPGLSDTRARLFSILQQFNRHSVPKGGGKGRIRRLASWFWLPSYFSWLNSGGSPATADLEELRRMGTLDPAAQLVSAQMVNVSWGNQQDAPLLLLETAFIQPPQLVQLRRACKRKILQAWLVLCFSAVLLSVLHFLV